MNINQLIKQAHDNAVEKGFYGDGDKNIGELLMLIVSELGEALEAHRENRFCKASSITIDSFSIVFSILTEKNVAYYEHVIKDTFEDEIADVFIRLADMCGYLNIDIEKHIIAKMAYNKTRPVKHGKEY